MAAALNINLHVRCEDCRFADYAGRSCEHGLLFPVFVFMSGEPCPNFQKKTAEQIQMQVRMLREQENEV